MKFKAKVVSLMLLKLNVNFYDSLKKNRQISFLKFFTIQAKTVTIYFSWKRKPKATGGGRR